MFGGVDDALSLEGMLMKPSLQVHHSLRILARGSVSCKLQNGSFGLDLLHLVWLVVHITEHLLMIICVPSMDCAIAKQCMGNPQPSSCKVGMSLYNSGINFEEPRGTFWNKVRWVSAAKSRNGAKIRSQL